MVSYLTILFGIYLVVIGFAYNILSDLIQEMMLAFTSTGLMLNWDTDTTYYFTIVTMSFTYCLMFIFPIMIWWVLKESQKRQVYN